MSDAPVLTIRVSLEGNRGFLALFEAAAAGQAPSWSCGYIGKTALTAVERGLEDIKNIADRSGKKGRYPRGYKTLRWLASPPSPTFGNS